MSRLALQCSKFEVMMSRAKIREKQSEELVRAEQRASDFYRAHPQYSHSQWDVAWVEGDEGAWFSVMPRARKRWECDSAVVRLIQGVYESTPHEARRILRHRIFTTAPLTEMCRGMVRVAAKTVTGDVRPCGESSDPIHWRELPAPAVSSAEVGDKTHEKSFLILSSPAQAMSHAEKLASEIQRGSGPDYLQDRAVGAVLVDADGRVLAQAANSNSSNKTLHAEVKLVQAFIRKHGGAIPDGARIFTTLKPCKMCAGMIWNCAENTSQIRVFYRDFDPGSLGRVTILNAESPERKRAEIVSMAESCPEGELEEQFLAANPGDKKP